MDIGISTLESINKNLSQKLGGDPGTQDISRVLRVPGTFNFKIPENPRPVTIVSNTHRRYECSDFQEFIPSEVQGQKRVKAPETKTNIQSNSPTISIDLDQLPISDRIKFLIENGKDETYVSRSEADMAVITAMVNKGVSETEIKQIFITQKIGDKYRSLTVDELKNIIHEAVSEDMEVWRETFEIMADGKLMGQIRQADLDRAAGKKGAFVAWDDLKDA